MDEYIEVGSIGPSDDDKTVKKSPLTFTNLNKATKYLTLKARLVFT